MTAAEAAFSGEQLLFKQYALHQRVQQESFQQLFCGKDAVTLIELESVSLRTEQQTLWEVVDLVMRSRWTPWQGKPVKDDTPDGRERAYLACAKAGE